MVSKWSPLYKAIFLFLGIYLPLCMFNNSFNSCKIGKDEHLTDIAHFFGVYKIKQNSRSIDGYPLSSLPDSLNWKVFYKSKQDRVFIKTQNDALINFVFEPDIKKQLFRIKHPWEDEFYELPYEHIDTNMLRVNGSLAGNYVDFTMHRINDLHYWHPEYKLGRW